MFFRCHDKVVSLVFVVDDVLEGDAELLIQVVEEVLLVHESNSGDLLNHGLGCRPSVPEVGGDGDGQLAAELLALETLKQKNDASILFQNFLGFSAELHHVSKPKRLNLAFLGIFGAKYAFSIENHKLLSNLR